MNKPRIEQNRPNFQNAEGKQGKDRGRINTQKLQLGVTKPALHTDVSYIEQFERNQEMSISSASPLEAVNFPR